MQQLSGQHRVLADAEARGVSIEFAERGPASSVEEAAANLNISPREIVKTLVAKAKRTQSTTEHTYVLALIPGDQQVDWAKLRKLAGMKKMSMAAPDEGLAATGYSPGSINPFGAVAADGTVWPVYADESISGRICMGAGEPDLNLFVETDQLFEAFGVITGSIGR